MKSRNKVILASLAFFGLIIGLAVYFVSSFFSSEIQILDTKRSPDGRWTAVVQMEVDSAVFVTVAIYTVRLKGAAQKDHKGDLVMNMDVNYPDPEPSIDWSDGKLVVTLANREKYLYLANPVSGVPIAVQWK
ncbi:MAG: hypothetical protein WAN35_01555 [Terracidiphilus sp.]